MIGWHAFFFILDFRSGQCDRPIVARRILKTTSQNGRIYLDQYEIIIESNNTIDKTLQ